MEDEPLNKVSKMPKANLDVGQTSSRLLVQPMHAIYSQELHRSLIRAGRYSYNSNEACD